ncbi:MAG: DUF1697 domain-containing protein [Coriobacteriales bacterium]|jgi:uncharacterized protein (DUF1697 family)|nr:DUF1697 domain-containing protein [Coriobacteriales bacterium]
MATYCAFLRGVNIGGKTMRMAEACDALQAAGLTGAVPVLATGNLVFESDMPQGELRGSLEQALSERFGDTVSLFVKSAEEVVSMLASAPFEENAELHTYALICEPGFEATLRDEFDKVTPSEGEAAKVSNGVFYWQCRKGATLDSGFSGVLGRKSMRDKFTSRNIRTVAKIAARMA